MPTTDDALSALVSPHRFNGRGPTPEAILEASRSLSHQNAVFLVDGTLCPDDIESVFEASRCKAEWLREVTEARDQLTAELVAARQRIERLERVLERIRSATGTSSEAHHFASEALGKRPGRG